DAYPRGVELRPLRDAVDVLLDLLARQLAELLPSPADRLGPAGDRERPLLERSVRCRPCGEDREVVRQVLPGRHPIGRALMPASAESPRDDAHSVILPGSRLARVGRGTPRSAAEDPLGSQEAIR